jgi:hypothetical protein
MDPRTIRINRKLSDLRLAQRLVNAGYGTPKLIKAATDEALAIIPGVSVEDVQTIRARIG